MHNPRNPKDRNAIEVRGTTGLLGHLTRDDAARYVGAIDVFHQRGFVPTTTARVWGRDGTDWDTGKPGFIGSVRVDLPEPHMMLPHNSAPSAAHRVVPTGSHLKVAAGEGVADATAPYLCDEGECWVYATLREVVQAGPRSSKQLAEVRIDDKVAGCLSPRMSEEVLPTVRFLARLGYVTAVRATVKGNQLKSEVVVHAGKSTELPHAWMDGIPDVSEGTPAAAATRSSSAGEGVLQRSDAPGLTHGQTSPLEGQPTPTQTPSSDAAASPAPPAGWYADPYGAARLRWWDGSAWTGHTAS